MLERVRTGDVIHSSCTDINMPCRHSGIVIEHNFIKYIIHNTPDGVNKHGGTIIATRLDEFAKERSIYEIVKTGISKERILEVYNIHKHKVWDAIDFNCEDFISYVVNSEKSSDVRDAWSLIFLSVVLLIFID